MPGIVAVAGTIAGIGKRVWPSTLLASGRFPHKPPAGSDAGRSVGAGILL